MQAGSLLYCPSVLSTGHQWGHSWAGCDGEGRSGIGCWACGSLCWDFPPSSAFSDPVQYSGHSREPKCTGTTAVQPSHAHILQWAALRVIRLYFFVFMLRRFTPFNCFYPVHPSPPCPEAWGWHRVVAAASSPAVLQGPTMSGRLLLLSLLLAPQAAAAQKRSQGGC